MFVNLNKNNVTQPLVVWFYVFFSSLPCVHTGSAIVDSAQIVALHIVKSACNAPVNVAQLHQENNSSVCINKLFVSHWTFLIKNLKGDTGRLLIVGNSVISDDIP